MCEGKEMLWSEKNYSMGNHLLQQGGKQTGKKEDLGLISTCIALGTTGKSAVNWSVKEATGLGSPQCSEDHRRKRFCEEEGWR